MVSGAPWGRRRWCSRTPRAPSSAPATLGAVNTRVVHLGTDVPPQPLREPDRPTVLTVGHLVARKRHADVLRALWLLRDDHPDLRWVVVGDGPERPALERMAAELELDAPRRVQGRAAAGRGAAAGHRVRAPQRRRGVRRRLRRGDGGRHPRHRLPRRGRPGGDPRQRRRDPPRRARRPREPGRGAAAPARGRRLAARARRRRRARPSSARSPGRRAAAPPSTPTARRCGEAGPVRHQPRAAVPRRRVREAARARGRRVRADRRRRPPRRRRAERTRTCRSRSSARSSTRSRSWRPATARWWRGCRGAWRRSRPISGPGGPACRTCCGRACGRTRGRSRTPPRTWWCATCTGTPTRSSPTGRTSRRTCAQRAQNNRFSRPLRASTTSIGTYNRPRFGALPFQAAFVGRIAGEKGPQVLIQAWSLSGLTALSAALVLVGGGPIRARAVATGAVLPEGPAAARRSTQLLRGKRRCGRTVGRHPRFPRALGTGGQRSLQPGSPCDRHRCRRRRRRRARPPRAHRARRPRGGRRRARRRAAADARRAGAAGAPGRRRAGGGQGLHARRVGRRSVQAHCGVGASRC